MTTPEKPSEEACRACGEPLYPPGPATRIVQIGEHAYHDRCASKRFQDRLATK